MRLRVYINARFLSQRISGVQRYAIEMVRRSGKMGLTIRKTQLIDMIKPPATLHHGRAKLPTRSRMVKRTVLLGIAALDN